MFDLLATLSGHVLDDAKRPLFFLLVGFIVTFVLARLNTLACIPIVGFLAVVQLGGHTAAQNVGVPDDFILLFVALILLFMAVTDLLRTGRLFGRRPREIVALTAASAPGPFAAPTAPSPAPGGSDE